MRKWVRQQFTSYVNCCLYLAVLLGLRGLNKQTERLQRADRNVLEHKVAVGRQRQSFDNRLGFFNRCGVHKEDHAAGLILAEPELVDLAVEIELQSVGDFLRQDPLPLLVRERLGKQTQSKNLHDCYPCSKVLRHFRVKPCAWMQPCRVCAKALDMSECAERGDRVPSCS